jgi:serine/threonine-protein kinase
VSRQTDVFAAAVVLWEALTATRLFEADSEAATMHKIRDMPIPPPSQLAPDLPPALDAVVMRGLARDPSYRFGTALEMAMALEAAAPLASAHVVGQYVQQLGGRRLASRAQRVAEIESLSSLRIVTGTGTFNRSVTGPAQNGGNKAELKKVAVLVLALAILLPGAWWLTHRRAATPLPTAAAQAPPPETTLTATAPKSTATAPATAADTTTAAAAATAADTAVSVDTLPTSVTATPTATAIATAPGTGTGGATTTTTTTTATTTATAKATATASGKSKGLYGRE